MTTEKAKRGRPVGWRKTILKSTLANATAQGVRKQRQLRALWLLIQEFAHKLKKLGKDKAAEVLKHFDA